VATPVMSIFVGHGLDPVCKLLSIFGSGPDLDWVNRKELHLFVVKKLHVVNI